MNLFNQKLEKTFGIAYNNFDNTLLMSVLIIKIILTERKMSINEKDQEFLDLLAKTNTVMSVKDIAKELFISEPTARRRLSSLSQKGLIIRTHGGAMINYTANYNKNIPLYFRLTSMSGEKNAIAKKAASLVKDGSVIFLDGSSTVFHMLPFLKEYKRLLVCTNSLKTAISLAEMGINTISLGGDVNLSNLSCNGLDTINMIKKFNADILFFSCDALSDSGILTDNSKESSQIRNQFMKNAAKKALLLDSTKMHNRCWYTLCSLSNVDYCFCDTSLPDNLKKMLKSEN